MNGHAEDGGVLFDRLPLRATSRECHREGLGATDEGPLNLGHACRQGDVLESATHIKGIFFYVEKSLRESDFTEFCLRGKGEFPNPLDADGHDRGVAPLHQGLALDFDKAISACAVMGIFLVHRDGGEGGALKERLFADGGNPRWDVQFAKRRAPPQSRVTNDENACRYDQSLQRGAVSEHLRRERRQSFGQVHFPQGRATPKSRRSDLGHRVGQGDPHKVTALGKGEGIDAACSRSHRQFFDAGVHAQQGAAVINRRVGVRDESARIRPRPQRGIGKPEEGEAEMLHGPEKEAVGGGIRVGGEVVRDGTNAARKDFDAQRVEVNKTMVNVGGEGIIPAANVQGGLLQFGAQRIGLARAVVGGVQRVLAERASRLLLENREGDVPPTMGAGASVRHGGSFLRRTKISSDADVQRLFFHYTILWEKNQPQMRGRMRKIARLRKKGCCICVYTFATSPSLSGKTRSQRLHAHPPCTAAEKPCPAKENGRHRQHGDLPQGCGDKAQNAARTKRDHRPRHAPLTGQRVVSDIRTFDEDLPLIEGVDARHGFEGGGLPCPIMADEGVQVAGANVQGEVGDPLVGAGVVFGQVLDSEHDGFLSFGSFWGCRVL